MSVPRDRAAAILHAVEVNTMTDEEKAEAFEDGVEAQLDYLRQRAEAQRRFEAEQARARPSIFAGLIDSNDLDNLPDPVMLMEQLIPEKSVGTLSGKFGTYKSFLALSWACSLAAGRPWDDDEQFAVPEAVKVLYVAAEGAGGMKARRRAWVRRYGDIPRGHLDFYPQPVPLNVEAVVDELGQVIATRGHRFVVIDTYHRCAPGVEDNSAKENGLIFEAAARLRDEHEVTVLFIDHTGHSGERTRGASSKEDDADFALLVSIAGEDRAASTQRTLHIRKRKDLPSEGEWPIRLVVDENDPAAAHIELGPAEYAPPQTAMERLLRGAWWIDDNTGFPLDALSGDLPDDVAGLQGRGRDAAHDIFRVLKWINRPDGMTQTEIRTALDEQGAPRRHGKSAFYAGLGLLKRQKVVAEHPEKKSRLVLAAEYRSEVGP